MWEICVFSLYMSGLNPHIVLNQIQMKTSRRPGLLGKSWYFMKMPMVEGNDLDIGNLLTQKTNWIDTVCVYMQQKIEKRQRATKAEDAWSWSFWRCLWPRKPSVRMHATARMLRRPRVLCHLCLCFVRALDMKGSWKVNKTHLLIIGYPSPRCLDHFEEYILAIIERIEILHGSSWCVQAVEKIKPRSRPGQLKAFGCELSQT